MLAIWVFCCSKWNEIMGKYEVLDEYHQISNCIRIGFNTPNLETGKVKEYVFVEVGGTIWKFSVDINSFSLLFENKILVLGLL